MAQKLIVLDLGSYSSKSLTLRFPVTGCGLGAAGESICPSALEAKTRRAEQLRLAKELLPARRLTADSVSMTFPAEKVLNRTLEMPFTDRRKIEQVLGFELENHVPMGADEFVFDYLMLEKHKASAKLFAGVVPKRDMDELKEACGTLNIDPRMILHQGVAHACLAEMLGLKGTAQSAFVDLGHRKTVVTMVRGNRFQGCRTIMTGGYDLTRGLADEMGLEVAEAEREKHQAHLFPAGEGTAVGRVQQVADCLQGQLSSLVRDLNQTFRSLGEPDTIYIFGGTARLAGIDQFLSSKFGKPVVLLYPSHARAAVDESLDSLQYTSGLACGYAAVRAGAMKAVNFRQGDYAYVGDLRFLRGRMVYLSSMVPAILALMLVPLFMQHASLVDQEALLAEELATLSEQVLGEALTDADETLARLAEVPSPEVWTVFPEMTAPEIYWVVADVIAQIDGKPTGEPPPAPEETPAVPGAEPGAVPAGPTVDPAAKGDTGAGVKGGLGSLDPATMGGAAGGDGVGLLPSLDGLGGAGGAMGVPGAAGGEVGAGEAAEVKPPEAPVHHLEMNSLQISSASLTGVGTGSVTFEGDASSVATMELFIAKLAQHRCFKSVQRTQQSVLESSEGKKGWSRFRIEVSVSCPARSEGKDEEEGDEKDSKDGKTEKGEKGEKSEDGDETGTTEKGTKATKGAKELDSGEAPEESSDGTPDEAAPKGSKSLKGRDAGTEEQETVPKSKPRTNVLVPGGPQASAEEGGDEPASAASALGSTGAGSSAAAKAVAGQAGAVRSLSGTAAGSRSGGARAATPMRASGAIRKEGVRPATRVPGVPDNVRPNPAQGGE